MLSPYLTENKIDKTVENSLEPGGTYVDLRNLISVTILGEIKYLLCTYPFW